MMVRYFYAWMPVVLVGTVVILICPWLALIALLVMVSAAVAALGALAWAFVSALSALGRSALSRSVPVQSLARSDARQPVVLNPGVGRGGTR
jgi:hypothetical protein